MSGDDSESTEAHFVGGYEKGKYGFNHQTLAALGERKVRDAVNRGNYSGPGNKHYIYVKAWLVDIDFVRSRSEPVINKVVKNVAEQVRKEPAPDHWYKKPIPVVGLGVTVALIVFGIKYYLKHKFGLDF